MAGGIGYMAADHAMNKKAVAHEAQLQVLESGVKVQESKVQNHAMNRTPVQAPEAQVEAPEAQVQAPEAQVQAPEAQVEASEAQVQAPEAQEQEFQEKVKRGVVFADAVAEDLLSDETDIAIPDEPSPINRSPIVRPL